MMANQYVQGNTVRVISDFTTVTNGNPADPSTVAVTITDPSGNQNTYTYAAGQVVRDSTGDYHYDVGPCNTVGVWPYYWLGGGTDQAAGETYFQIYPSAALAG
jgi:hypothetical protein